MRMLLLVTAIVVVAIASRSIYLRVHSPSLPEAQEDDNVHREMADCEGQRRQAPHSKDNALTTISCLKS